jgi:hypothetical protein
MMALAILGANATCHESWWRREYDEREASRELWDEFERSRPLSDPDVADEEDEVGLEQPDPRPMAADR